MPDTDTPELPEPHELHTPEALAAYTAQHQRWLHDLEHRAADDETRPMTAAERSYHTLVLAQLETARIAVQTDPTNGRGDVIGAVRDFERRAMYGRTAGRTRRGSQLASLGARVMHALHNPAGAHGLAIDERTRAVRVPWDELTPLLDAERANVATGVASVIQPMSTGAVHGLVPAGSVLDMLGVAPTHTVMDGQTQVGWVSTFPRAKHRAEDTSLAAIDAEGTVTQRKELTPGRFLVKVAGTIEAEITDSDVTGMFQAEAARALAEEAEREILAGDGTAASGFLEWSGLYGRAGAARTVPTDAADEADTWAEIIAAVEGLVDGRYARSVADLDLVLSSDLNAHLATVLRGGTADQTAVSTLRDNVNSLSVSEFAPGITAGASDRTDSIGTILARRGRWDGAYVWPVWRDMMWLADPYSAAGVGISYAAWTVSDWYIPSAAGAGNEARSDWRTIQIRTADVA